MGLEEPGSAARYLDEGRAELEAEKQAALEKDDKERFVERFIENGGTRTAAKEAYTRLLNAAAEQAAVEEAEAALAQSRRRIGQVL